jgi:hypothetical protein
MILTLLDIPVMMDSLRGVCMELQDCALTLLKGLIIDEYMYMYCGDTLSVHTSYLFVIPH